MLSRPKAALLVAILALPTIACAEGGGDARDGTTGTTTQPLLLSDEKLIDDLDVLPLEGKASSEDVAKVGAADGTPGTYHVLITNYLGILKQSFVQDREPDDEVWTDPVTGYASKLVELSCKTAIKILRADQDAGDPKRAARLAKSGAVRCFDVALDVVVRDPVGQVVTRRLRYVLGAQADGRVLAGEWLGPSVGCHPGSCPKK